MLNKYYIIICFSFLCCNEDTIYIKGNSNEVHIDRIALYMNTYFEDVETINLYFKLKTELDKDSIQQIFMATEYDTVLLFKNGLSSYTVPSVKDTFDICHRYTPNISIYTNDPYLYFKNSYNAINDFFLLFHLKGNQKHTIKATIDHNTKFDTILNRVPIDLDKSISLFKTIKRTLHKPAIEYSKLNTYFTNKIAIDGGEINNIHLQFNSESKNDEDIGIGDLSMYYDFDKFYQNPKDSLIALCLETPLDTIICNNRAFSNKGAGIIDYDIKSTFKNIPKRRIYDNIKLFFLHYQLVAENSKVHIIYPNNIITYDFIEGKTKINYWVDDIQLSNLDYTDYLKKMNIIYKEFHIDG